LVPTHLKGEKTTMKKVLEVANKPSESDKLIDFFKLMFDLKGFSVNIRKINKKEKEFLKSQGESVEKGVIYVIEKEKMAS